MELHVAESYYYSLGRCEANMFVSYIRIYVCSVLVCKIKKKRDHHQEPVHEVIRIIFFLALQEAR